VYRWGRLDDSLRKWILWSVTALLVLAAGTWNHDIWGLGIVGLFFWAIAD
jgi:hypothetical protein